MASTVSETTVRQTVLKVKQHIKMHFSSEAVYWVRKKMFVFLNSHLYRRVGRVYVSV